MNEDLDALLRQAAEADGLHRMDYRDAIAARGPESVRKMEPWLADPRLAAFAVRTITAAAAHGALPEARAALQHARTHADPTIRGDIDRALAALGVARGRPVTRQPHGQTGSPQRALEELQVLARDWRARGCPPQAAIKWRQPEWIATFPQHQHGLRRLPALLDRTDVRRVAAEAIRGPAEAEFAFLVVKAWGEGKNGYGPSRALESLERTIDPGKRLLTVARTLRDRDALAAYGRFADGGDCRIFNLGPAFGTKYLHFCQPDDKRPQALIHDMNISDWLHVHAGFPGASTAWSPRRYGAYLDQMHSWADDLGCRPEDVELCIFRSMLSPSNQWMER
jgi:hypothetical protein